MTMNAGFVLLPLLLLVYFDGFVHCQRPAVVNIGAVFTYNSIIGRVAKVAMEAAVDDVNADPQVLKGTQLNLIMKDANCSVFMGSIGAFQVLEEEVVAIIGPQSSAIAHMISSIANGLQVPLVSYAATDPTLSTLQFPFFLRTVQSDSYQMAAMADLIEFYGWKEVIAIFTDDDYGRNGISALDDELWKRMIKISHKLSLPTKFDLIIVTDLLNNSKLLGPRVYVVHINPDPNFRVFNVAQRLQMINNKDYIWLATDWLTATLDSQVSVNEALFHSLQGVVGLRQHTSPSSKKKAFLSARSGFNTYGLYAYDTVWAVARSVDKLLYENHNISFSFSKELAGIVEVTNLHIDKLKIFNNGEELLKKLLQTNFYGVTGQIQFNTDRNLVGSGFEVININGAKIRNVGYWSNASGLSVIPPEKSLQQRKKNEYFHLNQKLKSVTWPGGSTKTPRGWIIADDASPLRIGVPRRVSFVDFVTVLGNTSTVLGFCIDVFNEARKLVPYHVPYKFQPFGDGLENPSYDELVKMVADGIIDAAVGDIAIVANRSREADFTQPYASTGLVILAPIRGEKSNTWVFLEPFTVELWCAIAASFVLVGVVIWILEHRVNDDFRGPPKRQIITMILFSLSTLFKTNQEDTVSALGRIVMVVWLFVLMVISASYTASLTSILTVQQLSSSPITGLDSLINSNWPIGYQVGSFAYGYLTNSLNIPRSRLVPVGTTDEYAQALLRGPKNGGVAAIVDELPYVELFLSNRTDFGIVGQTFTRSGWGFAFQRESMLALDMSTAILKLTEMGELKKIHDRWFCKLGCPETRARYSDPNVLQLSSFFGLYMLCGAISLLAIFIFLLRITCQYVRYRRKLLLDSSSSPVTPNSRCSAVLHNFVDFFDKKEEVIKSLFTRTDNSELQRG